MSDKLLEKLTNRLLGNEAETADGNLESTFEELQDIDFDAISAAHVSDHGSVHYSQIQ